MGFLWGEKERTPYLQPRPLLRRAEQHGRRRARLVEAGVLEELVRSGDPSKARELEDRLDTRRIELAAVSSVGMDSFEEGPLSETDRSALLAMNNVGLRQLLSRITGLKDAVRKVEEDDTLTPEEVLTQQVGLRRQLIELQGQLSAYRQ